MGNQQITPYFDFNEGQIITLNGKIDWEDIKSIQRDRDVHGCFYTVDFIKHGVSGQVQVCTPCGYPDEGRIVATNNKYLRQ